MEQTIKTNEPKAIQTAKSNNQSLKVTVVRNPKQLTKVRTFELLSVHKTDGFYEDAEKLIGREFECIIADLDNGETMELCEIIGDPVDIIGEGLTHYFSFMPNYKIRVIDRIK